MDDASDGDEQKIVDQTCAVNEPFDDDNPIFVGGGPVADGVNGNNQTLGPAQLTNQAHTSGTIGVPIEDSYELEEVANAMNDVNDVVEQTILDDKDVVKQNTFRVLYIFKYIRH